MVIERRDADSLSVAFQALSDPTRRAILARLAGGEASVSELMAPFELSQPTISKHLKVLERAGLIEGGRDAQRRPRRLAPLAMQGVADWIDPFRRQWEMRLDNLEAHLAKMKREEKRYANRSARRPKKRPHYRSRVQRNKADARV
jgi:DNA-binding transcriptional ArsR family regulator